MKTKEKTIIEIEKTLKEKGLFSKELSDDELANVSGGAGFEDTGYAVDQRYLYGEFIDGTDKIVVMFRIVSISYPIIYVRFIYRINNGSDWEGMHDQFNANELNLMIANGEIVRMM